LTRAQIRELAGQGFAFGSHSRSHPPFRKISLDEARDEFTHSIDFIRNDLQLECKSFAFPFYDNNVAIDKYELMASLGIEVSFGTSAPKTDVVDFSLQRFSLSNRFSNFPAEGTLRFLSAKVAGYRVMQKGLLTRPATQAV